MTSFPVVPLIVGATSKHVDAAAPAREGSPTATAAVARAPASSAATNTRLATGARGSCDGTDSVERGIASLLAGTSSLSERGRCGCGGRSSRTDFGPLHRGSRHDAVMTYERMRRAHRGVATDVLATGAGAG